MKTSPKDCKAKDPSNCRYHTPNMHAQMLRDETKTEYEKALNVYLTTNPSDVQNREVEKLKKEYREAEKLYASYPEGRKELEEKIETLTGREKHSATMLLKAAEKLQAERNQIDLETQQRLNRFQEIKTELEEAEKNPNPAQIWKLGYQQALTQLFAEQGDVLQQDAIHQTNDYRNGSNNDKYYYGGREDYKASQHLQKCGALQAKELDETSYDEFAGTFADSDEGTVMVVRAKTTCKCGELVERYTEIEGTLTELTRDLLKF